MNVIASSHRISKHIVNIKTIRGVRAITNLKGYKQIDILSPSVLLESEV